MAFKVNGEWRNKGEGVAIGVINAFVAIGNGAVYLSFAFLIGYLVVEIREIRITLYTISEYIELRDNTIIIDDSYDYARASEIFFRRFVPEQAEESAIIKCNRDPPSIKHRANKIEKIQINIHDRVFREHVLMVDANRVSRFHF